MTYRKQHKKTKPNLFKNSINKVIILQIYLSPVYSFQITSYYFLVIETYIKNIDLKFKFEVKINL